MIDKEMLEAIGQMMDARLEPIKQDLSEVKQRVAKIEGTTENIEQRVTKIEVTQEQVTNKNIGLLMDAQVETRDKVKKLDKVAEDVEEIKVKVAALESVTKENTSQIKDIRLAK